MGKIANIGAIMNAMKDTTPEVAKSVTDYLSKKTQVNYDQMELKLKAAGYTVEQYFKGLEENSSSKLFIESYRNTAVLATQIEIIKNSTEMSDKEKIEELSKIHEREVLQQKEAQEELRRQRNDRMKAYCGIVAGIGLLSSKQVAPIIKKSTKMISAATVKVVKAVC